MMNDSLSIIIVNYNSGPFLSKCLKALFAEEHGFPIHPILVDNHSSDDSILMIEAEFPKITVIKNSRNLGFAKACNQGLAFVRSQYVLFLNPDAFVKKRTLRRCVRFMDANRRVGIMGCRLLTLEGNLQPSCADFPFVHKLLWDHFLRFGIFSNRVREKRLIRYWKHDKLRGVDWILGAFMLTRADLLKELGGFDEDFFLYGEDMELCYRIKQKGWHVVYLPSAEVIHVGNPVWDRKRVLSVHHAILTFYEKHFSFLEILLFRLFIKLKALSLCQQNA